MLEALYIILYEICVVTDGFMSYRNIHSEVTFMKYFDLKQTIFGVKFHKCSYPTVTLTHIALLEHTVALFI